MIRRISYEQFQTLCSQVIGGSLEKKEKPVVVVLADEAGDIIHMTHMDGAPSRSGIIASGKAFTAAKMSRTTTSLGQFCADSGQDVSTFVISGLTTMPGGSPIFTPAGELVGAVGVSGRSAAEDQELADRCAAFLGKLCAE